MIEIEDFEIKSDTEQADTYINHIADLYNVPKKVVDKMRENKETIQQELQNYFPYDIKVAINKHYKFKNDKERPRLSQIVAQLSGNETLEKKTREQIELTKAKESVEIYNNYKKQLKENLLSWKFSVERKNMIQQGADCFKMDSLMKDYIELQTIILNPLPNNEFFIGGLSIEFSHIKPTDLEDFENYTDYLRSKKFFNKVRDTGRIDLKLPEDIKNYLLVC